MCIWADACFHIGYLFLCEQCASALHITHTDFYLSHPYHLVIYIYIYISWRCSKASSRDILKKAPKKQTKRRTKAHSEKKTFPFCHTQQTVCLKCGIVLNIHVFRCAERVLLYVWASLSYSSVCWCG